MKKIYLALGILVLLCFGLTWPTTGSLTTALYTVTAFVMAAVIVPAAIIAIVLLVKGGKRKVKKVASGTLVPDAHHHDPTEHVSHDPHHHESGGDNHGHGGHHKKETGGFWFGMLILLLILLPLGLGFMLLNRQPAERHAPRKEHVETHSVVDPSGPSCPTDPIEPYTITAPPNGEAWSVRVPVPKCHRIRFCDRTQDPNCTAMDFAQSRFVPKCTSPNGSTIREFARARDKHSDACWIQSKGAEALSIDVIAEFDPST